MRLPFLSKPSKPTKPSTELEAGDVRARLLAVLRRGACDFEVLCAHAFLPYRLNTRKNCETALTVLNELRKAGEVDFSRGWYRLLRVN